MCLQLCWLVEDLIADIWLEGSVQVPGHFECTLPPPAFHVCLALWISVLLARGLGEEKQALALKTQGKPFLPGHSASSGGQQRAQSLRAWPTGCCWAASLRAAGSKKGDRGRQHVSYTRASGHLEVEKGLGERESPSITSEYCLF